MQEVIAWAAVALDFIIVWGTFALDQATAWAIVVLGVVQGFVTLAQALAWASVALGVGWVVTFVRFWRRQTRRIQENSGYATPVPRLWARLLGFGVVRIVARLLVGPITIDGNQEARKQRRKYTFVVVSNHRRYLDGLVLGKLAKMYRWRFMVAMEEVRRVVPVPFLRFCKIPAALFYALAGAIPVVRPGSEAAGGKAALRAAAAAVLGAVDAIKNDAKAGPRQKGLYGTLTLIALCALTVALHIWWLAIPLAVLGGLGLIDLFVWQPTHFLVFPQGRLVPDDNLVEKDNHSGPVKIGRRSQKETGKPVAFLVTHIEYEVDANGKVIAARVRVSAPIPLDDLPAKDDDAARRLFEEMVALKKANLLAKQLFA